MFELMNIKGPSRKATLFKSENIEGASKDVDRDFFGSELILQDKSEFDVIDSGHIEGA